MKTKHNKKRNTAFVYEALVKEATVAILKHNVPQKHKIANLIRKHFTPRSELYKELQCYRALYENQNLDAPTSTKIMQEAKIAQRLIDPNGLFKQQSALIKDINTELSGDIFNNYVPNYKTLASIAQLFSPRASPKTRVILEGQLIGNMGLPLQKAERIKDIDTTVINKFVQKFNDKYTDGLLDEQKELLSYYITSFADNALELKIFLNEEIARLKGKLVEARIAGEIKADDAMLEKTTQIIEKLESFSGAVVDEGVLKTVMKTQQLVKEINSHGNSS